MSKQLSEQVSKQMSEQVSKQMSKQASKQRSKQVSKEISKQVSKQTSKQMSKQTWWYLIENSCVQFEWTVMDAGDAFLLSSITPLISLSLCFRSSRIA